uniref:Uncharacterized protein n=1 Tax=viral metagenome TaxID=1070528 RepID=A0A6M3K315_9ZZZZ
MNKDLKDIYQKGYLGYILFALTIGAIIGIGYARKNFKCPECTEDYEGATGTIRKGDKGRDIMDFQSNLNMFTGKEFMSVNGLYTKETANAVGQALKGTRALRNPDGSEIDHGFIRDFNIMADNLKPNR